MAARIRVLPLSTELTTLYKGIGILLIVLHNFLHSMPPVIGENQFTFKWDVVQRFVGVMASAPQDWPRALFSYLGHYGVQIFVFASAYGLWRRYGGRPPSYRTFLADRFEKTYIPFLLAMLAYASLWYPRAIILGDTEPLALRSLLLKALLISNVVPGEAMRPVGPWWFASFIFQCYLLFPVLARLLAHAGPRALAWVAGGSVVLEWAFNPLLWPLGLNLNHTAIGHLPVLCLGLYAATRPEIRIGWVATAAVAGLFVAANLDATLWLLADVAAVVLLMVLPYPFLTHPVMRGRVVYRVLLFFGTISLPLFLVNGFLRSPFAQPAKAVDLWWFTLACAVISLLFSTAAALLLQGAERWLRARLPARRRSAYRPDDSPSLV